MAGLMELPLHGGGLNRAVHQYAIAHEQWLDLSTGINPTGWPVPSIPAEVFNRLPEADDNLIATAADYYGCDRLLPVAGSQQAIRELPRLRMLTRGISRVAVLTPGYAEHLYHWTLCGHRVERVGIDEIDQAADRVDVLVLINPCNPTACCFNREQLEQWHRQIAQRGGWLVVDEAFIDATPESSLIRPEMPIGLIVLRSLGKFFGLAGLRVGFVAAESGLIEVLSDRIDSWSIAHPSRWLAARALADQQWQREMRVQLAVSEQRLVEVLKTYFDRVKSTALFAWVETERASAIQEALARRAVLVRLFQEPEGMRFGLPGSEAQWFRLERALSEVVG